MSAFKKLSALALACLMLAGCNGQAAETTTEPAATTPAAETDENIVPANGCPDKTIDLRELANVEASYYETEEYCYLAVSDGENTVHEAKRCYIGEKFGGLTLSACRTRFYYCEDKLDVDMVSAEFDGEMTLSGYISKPEGASEVLFEPDAQDRNGRPLILGKTDSAAAEIAFRDYDMDGSERVRAEVTLKNLLLKWSNGSSSGLYDYADVVNIKYE